MALHPTVETRLEDLLQRVGRIETLLGIAQQPEPTDPVPPTVPPVSPSVPLISPTSAIAEPPSPNTEPVTAPRDVDTPIEKPKSTEQPPRTLAPVAPPTRPDRERRLEAWRRFSSTDGQPSPTPAPAPTPPKPTRTKSPAPTREPINLEWLIGGRAFAVAGALAVLVGIGFFIAWALERGLITPAAQCLMVGAFGGVLLGAGELVRRRIGRAASIGPSAAGLGAMYFAAFASHAVYHLIPLEAAMALMALVTALGIGIGTLTRLATIAAIAMLGGYLAPVMLGGWTPSTAFMPAYLVSLLVVGAGLSVVFGAGPEAPRFRWLRTLGWWGTSLMGTVWVLATGIGAPANALAFVGAVWAVVHAELLIASLSPLRATSRAKSPLPMDESSATSMGPWKARWLSGSFTTTAWAATLGYILCEALSADTGWTAPAALALLSASVAGLALTFDPLPGALRHGARTPREQLAAGMLVQVGALVIAAISLALGGWAEVGAWLALGVGTVVAGRWVRARSLAVYGLIVLSIAAARLLTIDLLLALNATPLWTRWGLVCTEWTVGMLLAGAAWIGAGALLARAWGRGWTLTGCAAACVGLSLIGLAPMHPESSGASVAMWWTALALLALAAARPTHAPWLRAYAVTAMTGALLWLLGVELPAQLDASWDRNIGGLVLTTWTARAVIASAAWFAATALLRGSREHNWRIVARVAACIACSLLAIAPTHNDTAPGALMLWWALIGFTAFIVGRLRASDAFVGYALFMLTLAAAGVLGVALPSVWQQPATGAIPLALPKAWNPLEFEVLSLALTPATAQAAAIATLLIAVALTLVRDPRELVRDIGRAAMALVCLIAACAPAHSSTELGAMTLWWAALGAAAIALHRVDRRFDFDIAGAALAIGAGLLWMFAFLRPGWMTTDADLALHPGLLSGLILAAEAALIGALTRRTARARSPRRAIALGALAYTGALVFLSTSLEAGRIAATLFEGDPTSRAAVLSIWWGLFAIGLLGVGSLARAPIVRYLGLGLFGLAAAKAVLFDLAEVSMGWRVVSFLGLGLLMVGVAVAYQRVAGARERREPRTDAGPPDQRAG